MSQHQSETARHSLTEVFLKSINTMANIRYNSHRTTPSFTHTLNHYNKSTSTSDLPQKVNQNNEKKIEELFERFVKGEASKETIVRDIGMEFPGTDSALVEKIAAIYVQNRFLKENNLELENQVKFYKSIARSKK